ncbi:probable proline--tRNA ligase, mitochondrial isoform X2 [Gigantopelta aegis]|uniref:probable proline--tRNA ligase, mitochondrial isoform X2 n=1 Tax=Gigantopelta aegis TaxID=1735272 RepID=UPI001B88D091|nr:probable proline--tRNA ligase, mitochondrial isoform X2 [Gigantopelta aegis]
MKPLCTCISGRTVYKYIQLKRHYRRYVSKMFQTFGKLQPPGTSYSCKSQKLMLYNDVIEPCHTGTYHLLPYGFRAFEKLLKVIDREMQAIGGQKMAMPSLAQAAVWKTSGRWDLVGAELFKLKDRHENEYCLGPITKKFRDEMNPKYALLRSREFEMKDMYTFDSTETKAMETYEQVCEAYCRIFDTLKVPYVKVVGATGKIGGKLSHEFHFPASIGEDSIFVCEKCGYGINSEMTSELQDKENVIESCPTRSNHCGLKPTPGIEVGHAFLLGTKYSAIFNAHCRNSAGQIELTYMGCFGLGVTRILQGCIEVLSSEKQIRWPQIIAPYQICIIPQKEGYLAKEFFEKALQLCDSLSQYPGVKDEVVIDDRIWMTVGKRQYEATRMGYPFIIVTGKQTLEKPSVFEVIDTTNDETLFLTTDQICDKMSAVKTV